MNIREDIRPISYIKANAAEVLDQVNESRRPIYVTQNGEARAVLLDTESYEKLKNAIGLLKLLTQGEDDIANGKVLSQDDFFLGMDQELGIQTKENGDQMIEVSAAIIHRGENILIAQRNRHKAQGLMWEFPGGKLEANESAQESLVREIKEELNIDIEVEEKLGESIYEYPTGIIKLIAFHAQWISGDLKPTEHESIRWVKLRELNDFEFAPADIPFIERLRKTSF